MKKLIPAALLSLAMVMATCGTSFAEYNSTNQNNTISWYNIIDGAKVRDYRSVSSSNHTPFYFSFNGFEALENQAYEMTLCHAGNSNSNREQWDLYIEGDSSRFQLEDLVYSNNWDGDEWYWVEQTFLVKAEVIDMVGGNWSFVLEPGTKRYSVIDLDWATISSVPVPGSLLILGSGLLILAGIRQKKDK